MEQERNVTQFQQDKPPACVPCSPKQALCPAWLCHPHATLAFSSQTAQLVSVGFSLIIPVSVLFLAVATGPSCLCPTLGVHPAQPRAKGTAPGGSVATKGQHGQAEPRGHSKAALAQGPFRVPGPRPAPAAVCTHTIPRARSAVPIKKKGRDEDCCY